MMKKNREVLRTCVICRKQFEKKDLIRLVRTNDNSIVVDPTFKMNGRGAYVSKDIECIENNKLKQKLQQSFKISISDEDFEALLTEIREGVQCD